jgi:predicted transcriptional regulator
MQRTQVYLTKKERDALARLAKATGRSRSDLLRQAVDRLIERSSATQYKAALDAAAGLWKDRNDLPDFRALRAGWDRS